jgi:hypothetical protein
MWIISRWLIRPLVNSDVVSMFDLPKVRSRLPETSQASHSVMLIRSLVVKGGEVDPTAT